MWKGRFSFGRIDELLAQVERQAVDNHSLISRNTVLEAWPADAENTLTADRQDLKEMMRMANADALLAGTGRRSGAELAAARPGPSADAVAEVPAQADWRAARQAGTDPRDLPITTVRPGQTSPRAGALFDSPLSSEQRALRPEIRGACNVVLALVAVQPRPHCDPAMAVIRGVQPPRLGASQAHRFVEIHSCELTGLRNPAAVDHRNVSTRTRRRGWRPP
ncbi:hypothetical protein EBO15_37785 [Actinomadura harenae]|uniref:Uncharacterized protein n=2 Tax=Actinomadura harenae TaxID=2483351 RepID=A0A3M2LGW9_9ACTN|nr:hypothetical protein EBO15_37785 [Actinomadura harenae]